MADWMNVSLVGQYGSADGANDRSNPEWRGSFGLIHELRLTFTLIREPGTI